MIPGHFRAYTFWLLLALSIVAYMDNWQKVLGVALILIGGFLGDQATHLAQADHSGPPATPIEGFMQKNRWFSVIFGTAVAIIGIIIIS